MTVQVTLLQDDLKWLLDNRTTIAGSCLKYSGRHRLSGGALRFLPFGALALQDGKPVVDVGGKIVDNWFANDGDWMLPSARNVARMANLFGLGWPETFHLLLKLEWERFLSETHLVTAGGKTGADLVRLVQEDEQLPAVLRKNALPLRTWPVRAFQRADGSSASIERYPDLIDEFCEAWLGRCIGDIQREMDAAVPSGIDPRAFAPPGPRRVTGHCYYILINFIIHQDIQRASLLSPIAQQFHAALRSFMALWDVAESGDQVTCLLRLEKWHIAAKAFGIAAVQLETARQVHKQIETRWYLEFGEMYAEFLTAHQRKDKLANFLHWLQENPRLTENEMEQRHAAAQGAKDKAEIDTLTAGRVIAGLNDSLKGEGASQDEVLEYFSDMKRMYRSIAWLTHPDRHPGDVPAEVREELNALWLEAAAIRSGDDRAGTTLRRAELRLLIQRARDVCQQANLAYEERLLPFEEDLASTNIALLREITGLESDAKRVRAELNKLAADQDFVTKRRDLDPPEAVPERLAEYALEVDQLKRDIAAMEAAMAAAQQGNAGAGRKA